MKRLLILIAIALGSCHEKGNVSNVEDKDILSSLKNDILPFELTIYQGGYSMDYQHEYTLNTEKLSVIFKSRLKEDKDSILFETELLADQVLKTISLIKIDSLQERYVNPCIKDGSQIEVTLKKENKHKVVHLSNYYQDDIGLAIHHINSLVPEKYKIWYDKEALLREQEYCK